LPKLHPTTNTYTGAPAAAQSGSVTGGQSSTLSVVVNGLGTLTFYWSSIANDNNQGLAKMNFAEPENQFLPVNSLF